MIEAMLMGGGIGMIIEKVQTISIFADGGGPSYVIEPVDISRSFLIVHKSGQDQANAARSASGYYLSNETTLMRDGRTDTLAADTIQIVTARSGILVTRGIEEWSGQTSPYIPFGKTIDPSKSIMSVSAYTSSTTINQVSFEYSSGFDSVRFRHSAAYYGDYKAFWELIDFE